MNKTPIEFLIDHYGCADEVELHKKCRFRMDIAEISEVIELYAHAYHEDKIKAKGKYYANWTPKWPTNFA